MKASRSCKYISAETLDRDKMENSAQKLTRNQKQKRKLILDAALDVFSLDGFRGASLDEIALRAGISKPNLLYYYTGKEEIHTALLTGLLGAWLAPLRAVDPDGDPLSEVLKYLDAKWDMATEFPLESRLFANEILRGAPHLQGYLKGSLKELVIAKSNLLQQWMDQGKLRQVDPRHLIFSIWAMTQHYADFDAQVTAILGDDRAANFAAARKFQVTMVAQLLRP